MKKLSALLVSASIICALKAYAGDIHWGYIGAGDPEKWGDLDAKYATCKTGKYQSPINIVTAAPTVVESLAFNDRATPLKMINNGHTIQVNIGTESTIQVYGKAYTLLQLHFHSPSEHTMNGKEYAMEVHLVHKNDEGQLAVVGGAHATRQTTPSAADVNRAVSYRRQSGESGTERTYQPQGFLPTGNPVLSLQWVADHTSMQGRRHLVRHENPP
jgi:carbonic anhydrase